jgi:nucleoside-specific outer membrane channel protein Tsx
MLRKLLSLLVLIAALADSSAQALDWSDNSFSYRYGSNFKEPGVGTGQGLDIGKNILAFTHVDGWKYGGNFLNVDMLISAGGAFADRAVNSRDGATEVYAVYRTHLSLNKMTGSNAFAFGPIRDLRIETGIDLNTKNTAFAPHKIMPVLGPTIELAVPGFWSVSLFAEKEWNNNGIANVRTDGTVDFSRGGNVEFNTTLMVATAWGVPLFGLPLSFEGFGSVNLPKGKDGFNNETKTELLFHPKVMWDVGSAWGSPKSGYKLGVGWEYWVNKFGNDHNAVPGSLASTPFIEAAVHL